MTNSTTGPAPVLIDVPARLADSAAQQESPVTLAGPAIQGAASEPLAAVLEALDIPTPLP
jgi:hypothetical protein